MLPNSERMRRRNYWSERVKVNNTKILDTNMIFARDMALLRSQRSNDTTHLIAYELAHRRPSIFDDRGAINVAKTSYS